jgi:4-amino-4-deoxy-L-arabinose transferase-like glycosyltransferase
VVGGAAVIVLAAVAPLLWTGESLHAHSILNDQVGYVTASRRLLEAGSLRSSVHYPGLLDRPYPTNVPYMPGHYYVLALAQAIGGYHVGAAFAPSLVAYVAGVVLLFLLGKRLFGWAQGLAASLLFALLLPHILFAYSAMMEMVLTGIVLSCFLVSHVAAEGRRWVVAGAVLAVPSLFRETAAELIPLGALYWYLQGAGLRAALSLAGSGGLSVVLLALASGYRERPHFFDGLVWKKDAMYAAYEGAGAFQVWAPALVDNAGGNLVAYLAGSARALLGRGHHWLGFGVLDLLTGAAVLAVAAAWRGPRHVRAFTVLAAGALAAPVAATIVLFTPGSWEAARMGLIAAPFVLLAAVEAVRARPGRTVRATAVVLLAGFAALTFLGVLWWSRWIRWTDAFDRRATTWLSRLDIPDRSTFVGPPEISLDYVWRRYPVEYGLLPRDEPSLLLMLRSLPDVSVVVAPVDHPLVLGTGGEPQLAQGRFLKAGEGSVDGRVYAVYKRAPERP